MNNPELPDLPYGTEEKNRKKMLNRIKKIWKEFDKRQKEKEIYYKENNICSDCKRKECNCLDSDEYREAEGF